MRLNGQSLAGIGLVLLGLMVFFGMAGVHIGGIIALVLAIVLACYGIRKFKGGHKVAGTIALILAFVMFGGSLPFLITLLFAVICIGFGWKLMKGKDRHSEPALAFDGDDIFRSHQHVEPEKGFDTEWKDFLIRHGGNNQ